MVKKQELQDYKMRQLNIYSFHRNINQFRFDAHNTYNLIQRLNKKYDVVWHNKEGSDNFHYVNDCDVLINQGSIVIFEFDDTKEFKTFDFGDSPSLTVELAKSKNFVGAAIGQYNDKLWDGVIKNEVIRKNVKPSIYPETYWDFGIQNFSSVQEYRNDIELDTRLYWRGSTYKNHPNSQYNGVRDVLYHISDALDNFYFADYPISFDQYIQEAIKFKLVLGIGGGGGYLCGDFCFRDIEMFGLGIPVIRPKFAAQTADPLLPNVHYIAVDCEFDEQFKYKNPEKLANNVIDRYNEVVNDDKFLSTIANNARNWYIRNNSSEYITDKILESLGI
jgi:hypothetical protein